jgi:ubiquinone/menaquinone biosynthesis C-methylase UbiE
MSSLDRVLARLEERGLPTDPLTVETVNKIDLMHMGGAESTDELIKLGPITAVDRVLDAGCGIGGTSRRVANLTGALVTGLDITPEAVESAIEINHATGMNDLVDIHLGTSTAMPFGDNAFDVVLIQHCAMQIEAKVDLIAECRRVLRSGGRLLFHDWFVGDNQPLLFPVPWASDEKTSFLEPLAEMTSRLESTGFDVEPFIDQKVDALRWLAETRELATRSQKQNRELTETQRKDQSISTTMIPNLRDERLSVGFLSATAR